MRGINKVTILGTMGSDPEMRKAGEHTVASISLATNEKWKDSAGVQQERTEWHRIEFWNRQAEIIEQYTKKGSKLYIEGQLRTDKYQDKETGTDRWSTKIIGRQLQLLGDRAEGGGSPNAATVPSAASAGADFDDDIPF